MASNIKPYSKQTVLLSKTQPEKKETRTGKSTYEIWLSRLSSTLSWRQSRYDKEWIRCSQMFKGNHWRDRDSSSANNDPRSDEVRERITVNVTMSSVLNLVPFLMQASPAFQCKPRKPETNVSAKLQQEVLNYEFQQREMFAQCKKTVYDCCTIGHGIAKTGYILELDEAISKAEGEIVYEDYIKESSPYVKRINPLNFLIDPTASENNLETARWCAEIFYKTERDVLANESYDPSVRRKMKERLVGFCPNHKNSALGRNEEDLSNLSKSTDDPALPESQLVMLFEVWDKKYKTYFIFADGVEEPLLEKPWPYDYIDNFPYIKVDFIPIADELYGVGVPYCIEDQQFELNRVRTSAFEHRRRFNRKYEVNKSVDEDELNKLVEGEDGTVIRVQQTGSIVPIQDASLPQDAQLVEAMIRADIQELTGLDALLRGGQLPSRTTAGEVSTRTSLFRLKLDDRVEAIDKFVLKVGTQVLQHIKANFTSDRLVLIVGEQGTYWETLSPELIKDEVDVSMETISAPKVDPMIDRQQRLQIWQISMQALPLIQAGALKIDMNQLFAWVLEAFEMKDAGRFFSTALQVQPPLQEQSGLSNLNQEQVPVQQPDFNTIFQQANGAPAMNSGFQLGG